MFLRPPSGRRSSHGAIKNARRWSYGAGKIKNARRWLCGAEKIKCCYQLRGHEKHVHSKEGSTGHLYKCSCASTSV